ncbi:hypothetical protein GCM10010346_19440 [Streptomyces chryseus]|uniref:DNA-binding protein n=1 Tax=Streptomyces chryseus TaxID=68186 RepID=A0ABQ3DLM9_9ACTN|nr:hypothetical protein GCM10010346_19440 [Streptomyces chryseus]
MRPRRAYSPTPLTAPTPLTSPGPAATVPAPRPPRPRRVVLAAAAVAVLAAGVAALAFAGPGTPTARSAEGRGPTASAGRSDGADATRGAGEDRTRQSPAGAPGARPGTSGPSASRTPSATAEPKRSGTPTTRAPRPARRPGGAPAGVPFGWTVDSDVWQSGCDHGYLVARGPDRVPPPPVEQDAGPWARSLDALHAGDTNVRVTLRGTSERAVVLEALRVRVTQRDAPARGNVYGMSDGCGGALSPRHIAVDLDAPRPVARSVAGFDGVAETPIPAVAFPYTVSVTDPEVLLVNARTAGCDCRWYLELVWSSGARSGTVRISDNGRPFRTSGAKGMPRYAYSATEHRWITSR